jgi:hypothetical protein
LKYANLSFIPSSCNDPTWYAIRVTSTNKTNNFIENNVLTRYGSCKYCNCFVENKSPEDNIGEFFFDGLCRPKETVSVFNAVKLAAEKGISHVTFMYRVITRTSENASNVMVVQSRESMTVSSFGLIVNDDAVMNYENTITISLPVTKDASQESTPSGYESQRLSEYSANPTPNGPSTFFSYDVSGIPKDAVILSAKLHFKCSPGAKPYQNYVNVARCEGTLDEPQQKSTTRAVTGACTSLSSAESVWIDPLSGEPHNFASVTKELKNAIAMGNKELVLLLSGDFTIVSRDTNPQVSTIEVTYSGGATLTPSNTPSLLPTTTRHTSSSYMTISSGILLILSLLIAMYQ